MIRLAKKTLLAAALVAALALAPGAAAATGPDGQTRVIVTLTVSAQPSADEIAAVTDQVLSSLPAGEFTVIGRFSTMPYVNLSVSASAQAALVLNGLVAAVETDKTVKVSGKRKCKSYKTKSGQQVRICKRPKAPGKHK